MESKDSKRRLAAIFFADVSDYSRFMGIEETRTHNKVMAHRAEVIDPKIAAHHGHIVHTAGDGLLAEFSSVVRAVECAIDIQQEMSKRNVGTSANQQLLWRIGINLGDVIVEGGDIFGDGVNIAARLEKLAEPGGICISATVFSEVKNRINIRFESLGEHWLKNIKEPVLVYRPRLNHEAGQALSVIEAFPSPQAIDRPSIVVLPFTNLTPSQDKQYIVDGLTEDLITSLSMSPEFFVIARTSSFAFQERQQNLSSVARQLGVRYVVVGSVQQDSIGFRVSAQLIEAESGVQLWTGRFDRKNAELLEVRDEITNSIAATLMTTAGEIAKAELTRQSRKSPENFSVYDRYLKARSYFHRSLRPPWPEGKQASELAKLEFKRAMEMSDPPYWPLYAGLAWQHAIDFDWSYSDDENKSLRLAFENAEIAVKNAADSHLAHWILGWAYLYAKRNHQRALYHYLRARELNIGDSRLLAEMAQPLIYSGESESALRLIHQAIRLNPFHEQWYDEFLAWAYEESGQPERTIETLSRLDDLEGIWSYAVLARAYAQIGKIDEFGAQIEVIDKLVRERRNTKFSLQFWKEWVAQREPYKDHTGSERIFRIMEDALKKINWPN